MTWLAFLPPDSRAVVTALPRQCGLARRLIAMGLTPGAEVHVLQNRGRGPLIIEVHGVRLALGRGQAARVAVDSLTPSGSEESASVAQPDESDAEA
ncbi:MAG: ferrous iron transport protein A [Thermoleophilia bacterium]|nr:ferrous iron transport protein A [Thermoleophilia bacterium]